MAKDFSKQIVIGERIGWFREMQGGLKVKDIDENNAWKLDVLAGAIDRNVRWKIESLGDFKFPNSWEGTPSTILTAKIGGLLHVVNEEIEVDQADAFHILRCTTDGWQMHSLGYFTEWPENWQRN